MSRRKISARFEGTYERTAQVAAGRFEPGVCGPVDGQVFQEGGQEKVMGSPFTWSTSFF